MKREVSEARNNATSATSPVVPFPPSGVSLKEVEKQYILRVLEEADNNKARAASILGISRETLYQKLKQYQSE